MTTTHPYPRKRIIVCCDGTWQDSDGDVQVPSNVTRISRTISPIGLDHTTNPPTPISQVVFYQNGVGTGSKSMYTRLVGGATGEGISINIREAYAFICLNYHDGDEIILIGFSRGAFTARTVSTIIRAIGLLTPNGLQYLTHLFEDLKFENKPGWVTRFPLEPWANRGKVGSKEYQRNLANLELSRLNIPIKCVAVWDTVGALGIPKLWLLPQRTQSDYQLVNTVVEPNIEFAYQALALDEHRRPYHPTVWEKPQGQEFPRVLKQTWFPGVHSDVGGSYEDADLANITLAWMVSQLDHLITFKLEVVTREFRKSRELHEEHKEPIRDWGLGKIHDSMDFFFRVFGSVIRTPMEYREIDFKTTTSTRRLLENTNEYVHSSVRIRMNRDSLGYENKGPYDPAALKGWTFNGTLTAADTPIQQGLPGDVGKMTNVKWTKLVKRTDLKGKPYRDTLTMKEDTLGSYERLMLAEWPDVLKEFDSMMPGKHQSDIRRASTYPANHASTFAPNPPMLTSPEPLGVRGPNGLGVAPRTSSMPVAKDSGM